MATGLPDFTKTINIGAQTLNLIENRFSYGSPLWTQGQENIIGAGPTTLVSISGKGVLVEGWVTSSDASSDQKNDYPFLILDGQTQPAHSFYQLWVNGITRQVGNVRHLTIYDPSNYVYGVRLAPLKTFESSMLLAYLSSAGFACTVTWFISYYLV